MSTIKIKDVLSNDLCSGCGLCAEFGDISIIENDEGFLRPIINGNYDKKADSICPGVNTKLPSRTSVGVWGEIYDSCLAFSSDEDIRFKGSSGGVLTAICKELLESGAVDVVVTTGVDSNNCLKNRTYTVTDPDFLKFCASSRYSPSSPLVDILSTIKKYEKLCVVGKPCDIQGLRNLQKVDAIFNEKTVIMLSFFCAGVPSYKSIRPLLKSRFSVDLEDVTSLKYRGEGWPGMFKVQVGDQTYELDYEESWGSHFNKYLQSRCKFCFDGIGEAADIVCGDAWDIVDGRPDFSDKPGKSLVLTRSIQGEKILESCLKSGALLKDQDYDVENLYVVQRHQLDRRRFYLMRILSKLILGRLFPRYGFYRLLKCFEYRKPIAALKVFFGSLIRETRRVSR